MRPTSVPSASRPVFEEGCDQQLNARRDVSNSIHDRLATGVPTARFESKLPFSSPTDDEVASALMRQASA